VDTTLSSLLFLSQVKSKTVVEFPRIEDVTFSVYVLGLVEDALALLSFLQEKKINIPANTTENRAKFFMFIGIYS